VIELTTRPLSAERVIQAFPLIQTALPEVTLAAWRDFAARVVPDLVHGRLLDAGLFLAYDLLDRRPVAEALAAAVEALARQRGCTAVHTHLPQRNDAPTNPDNGLSRVLAARGHRIESLGLCKRLVA